MTSYWNCVADTNTPCDQFNGLADLPAHMEAECGFATIGEDGVIRLESGKITGVVFAESTGSYGHQLVPDWYLDSL